MDVRLLVHLERVDGGTTWWAESPEVPGFSVAAGDLLEVQHRAKWALTDILAETGDELGRIAVELVPTEPPTTNPAHPAHSAEHKPEQNSGTGRTRVASPA